MPSRKGMEQATVWLKSKIAEGDTLDAINAELTYNVLMDLKKRKDIIGARYHEVYKQLKSLQRTLSDKNQNERHQKLDSLAWEDRLYEMVIRDLERRCNPSEEDIQTEGGACM